MDSGTNSGGLLGHQLVEYLTRRASGRTDHLAVENVKRNLARLDEGQSISALRGKPVGEGDAAIVIAAGPSLWKQDPLARILESGFKGAVIVAESAMAYCLRGGLVPDMTVTVDPDDKRIIRFFGDPDLNEKDLLEDDYFRRLERDFQLNDEVRANEEVLRLLNEHGHKFKIALSTSTSEALVNRVFDIGMDAYWWNPMLDSIDAPDSTTAEIRALNGLPCINAGGNVGTAAWMMAHAVLGKKHVALLGMDFSYYADNPYSKTHYYWEAIELVGEENLDSVFMHLENPHTGELFYTDPALMLYRNVFLELADEADCTTYNCTGGGILFGDPVQFTPLEAFLDMETG